MGQAKDILGLLMADPEIAAFSSKKDEMAKDILESVRRETYNDVTHAVGYREICSNLNEMVGRVLMDMADQEQEPVLVHVDDLEPVIENEEVWCSKCAKFKRPVDWRRRKWQYRICPACTREKARRNKKNKGTKPKGPEKSEQIIQPAQSEEQAYEPEDECLKCGAPATHMKDETVGNVKVKVCMTCGWENWI